MFSRSIFEKDLHNSLYVIKKRNKLAIFSCVMSIIKTPHLLPSIIFNSHIISQIKSFIPKSEIIVASPQIIFPAMNRGEVHSKLSFLTTINIFRRLLYYHRIYLMYQESYDHFVVLINIIPKIDLSLVMQSESYYFKIKGSIIIATPNRANKIPPIFVVFRYNSDGSSAR